jgi:hypothetical protein
VNGSSELFRLPYFDVAKHSLLDMMHLVQGTIQRHLIGMIVGSRGDAASKRAEVELLRFGAAQQQDDACSEADEADSADDEGGAAADEPPAKRQKAAGGGRSKKAQGVACARAAAAAKAAVTAARTEKTREDLEALNKARARWKRSEKQVAAMEAACAELLQARDGTFHKDALSRPWSLNAYDWVAFVKSYGKYMLGGADGFGNTGAQYIFLCALLDFVRLCLSATLTPEVHDRITERRQTVAQWFSTFMPATEHAIVFHLLIFHMPAQLKLWGSARHHWCFPFERSVRKVMLE